MLFRNFITSPTPLLRKSSFQKISGFESKYIPYEDWECWIRLSLLGKFYFINEPLSYYRIHPAQSVKIATAKKIEKVTSLLLINSLSLKDVSKKVKNKALGLANLRFCYWYLLSNEINIAKEKINKAIELYPEFIFDPRWYGLKIVCSFPQLLGKGIFNLEQYH